MAVGRVNVGGGKNKTEFKVLPSKIGRPIAMIGDSKYFATDFVTGENSYKTVITKVNTDGVEVSSTITLTQGPTIVAGILSLNDDELLLGCYSRPYGGNTLTYKGSVSVFFITLSKADLTEISRSSASTSMSNWMGSSHAILSKDTNIYLIGGSYSTSGLQNQGKLCSFSKEGVLIKSITWDSFNPGAGMAYDAHIIGEDNDCLYIQYDGYTDAALKVKKVQKNTFSMTDYKTLLGRTTDSVVEGGYLYTLSDTTFKIIDTLSNSLIVSISGAPYKKLILYGHYLYAMDTKIRLLNKSSGEVEKSIPSEILNLGTTKYDIYNRHLLPIDKPILKNYFTAAYSSVGIIVVETLEL